MSTVPTAPLHRLESQGTTSRGTIEVAARAFTASVDERSFSIVAGDLIALRAEPRVRQLHELEGELRVIRHEVFGDGRNAFAGGAMAVTNEPRASAAFVEHLVDRIARELFPHSRIQPGVNDVGLPCLTVYYDDETSETDELVGRIITLHERIQEAMADDADALPAIYVRSA